MQRFLLIAFLACCASACASPMAKECPVIIGFGNYVYNGPQVVSSSSTPGFLSDPAYLFDGQPSTLTRIQWGDGTQTTSSFTGVEFQLAPSNPALPLSVDYGMVAILNSSLPVGLVVEVRDSATTGTLLATTTMQDNGNGTTSAWVFFPIWSSLGNLTVVMFRNNVNGHVAVAPSAEFTTGDIFAGNTIELPLKRDVKDVATNPPKVRLASAGTQWTVLPPEVRTFVANMPPLTQKQVYVGENGVISIKALISAIYTNSVFAYVPFLYYDPSMYGAFTPGSYAYDLIAQTAYLAAFSQPPSITQNGDMYYDVTFTGQESV